MRLACIALVLSIAALARPAGAAGINLAWDDCGPNGVAAKTWACDANEGRHVLIGSVVPPVDVPRFVGVDLVLWFGLDAATVPPWWDFTYGTGCRSRSVVLDTDFSETPSGGTACADVFAAEGAGGVADYDIGFIGPNRARLIAFWATPDERALTRDVETYLFRLVLDHVRTVGTDACAGCATATCVLFYRAVLVQPAGVGDFELSWPHDFQTAGWNGGSGSLCSVAVRRATWGAIKSLYR